MKIPVRDVLTSRTFVLDTHALGIPEPPAGFLAWCESNRRWVTNEHTLNLMVEGELDVWMRDENPKPVLDALTLAWETWLGLHQIPLASAEEVLHAGGRSPAEMQWVNAFVALWDLTESRDDEEPEDDDEILSCCGHYASEHILIQNGPYTGQVGICGNVDCNCMGTNVQPMPGGADCIECLQPIEDAAPARQMRGHLDFEGEGWIHERCPG